jgi:hypothetical protein
VAAKVSIDTREFKAALAQYTRYSKRSLAEIVNKRAVNIAFKAIRHTPKTKKPSINRELRQKSRVAPKAPLGAILAQKGRNPGLYGDEMKKAVESLKAKKAASIGFIKSGWIGAVRDLSPHAKVYRRPPRVIVKGKPQGFGRPARRGLNPTAEIVNQVAGAVKVGSAALQRAINEDALDMKTYVARKMNQDAKKFNAR